MVERRLSMTNQEQDIIGIIKLCASLNRKVTFRYSSSTVDIDKLPHSLSYSGARETLYQLARVEMKDISIKLKALEKKRDFLLLLFSDADDNE